MASGVIDTRRITYDLLFSGKPSAVDTFEVMNLRTGKRFSNYTTLMFVAKFYGNVMSVAVLPTDVFKTLIGSGQRLQMFANDSLAVAQAFYASETSIGIAQHDIATHSLEVYGMYI